MTPTVLLEQTDDVRTEPVTPPPDTPVLRLDTSIVRDRFLTLQAALPTVALHYAVKANPAQQVLRTLTALGCKWDVASPGEIDAVLDARGEPADCSYGNTIKKSRDIAAAHRCGIRSFTVDSPAELEKVLAHAPGSTVLVRLTTSCTGADWALGGKFGCSGGEAATLLHTAAAAGHPVGVAFHVGSQQRDPNAWDAPLRLAAHLREGLRRHGSDLDVMDIGGGFPAGLLDTAPPIEQYGTAIEASLRRHFGADRPDLIAEPGRHLVADAGVLDTEVVLVSQRAGARWVYLDAGDAGETILAGPTCDSLDILYQHHRYPLPLTLRPGDRLRFHSAGAYTATYSTVGFNGFAPLREEYVESGGPGGWARPPSTQRSPGHRSPGHRSPAHQPTGPRSG